MHYSSLPKLRFYKRRLRAFFWFLSFFFGLALSQNAFAQKPLPDSSAGSEKKHRDTLINLGKLLIRPQHKKLDSSAIEVFPLKEVTLGLISIIPNSVLQIQGPYDTASVGKPYVANLRMITGLDVSYRHVGLTLGIRLPQSDNKLERFGETQYNYFGLKVHVRRLSTEFSYGFYRGFFVLDSIVGYTQDNQEKYYVRDRMFNENYTFKGLYNFSWRSFSILSAMGHLEQQKKTKAAFLMRWRYANSKMKDSEPLHYVPSGASGVGVRGLNYMTVAIGPGAGLYMVFLKNFYFTTTLFIIPQLNYSQEQLMGNKNYQNSLTTMGAYIDWTNSLGYQNRHFYAVLHAGVDSGFLTSYSLRALTTASYVRVDLGIRTRAPRWLKRGYDRFIGRTIGL
jgi:hypothetical protein